MTAPALTVGTRVRHHRDGALGTVVGVYAHPERGYVMVQWDDRAPHAAYQAARDVEATK